MAGCFLRRFCITLVLAAGFRLRALLVHQVFRKVLRLTPAAQQHFSSGKVFNLVTSDAETLQALCQNILGVISSPARIVGAMVLLYVQLGPASLVALATLVIMIPIMASLLVLSSQVLSSQEVGGVCGGGKGGWGGRGLDSGIGGGVRAVGGWPGEMGGQYGGAGHPGGHDLHQGKPPII